MMICSGSTFIPHRPSRPVRRQELWASSRPEFNEGLAHPVGLIGIAGRCGLKKIIRRSRSPTGGTPNGGAGLDGLDCPSTVSRDPHGLRRTVLEYWRERFIEAHEQEAHEQEVCEWGEAARAGPAAGPGAWDGYGATVVARSTPDARGKDHRKEVEETVRFAVEIGAKRPQPCRACRNRPAAPRCPTGSTGQSPGQPRCPSETAAFPQRGRCDRRTRDTGWLCPALPPGCPARSGSGLARCEPRPPGQQTLHF